VLRIRDVYPGSRTLIFTHPGYRIQKQQQKRGVKFLCHTFFVAKNFTKLKFFFGNAEEKKLGQFLKNNRTFCPQNCHKALKNMGLGAGTQRLKRHRIPNTDPQHCLHLLDLVSPACLTAVLKQESAFSSSSTRTYSWPSNVYAYANRLSTCTARWKNLNKKKDLQRIPAKDKFISVLWIRNEFFRNLHEFFLIFLT
jgi:hypothetical protein